MASKGPLGRGKVEQAKASRVLLQSDLETKSEQQWAGLKGRGGKAGRRSSTCAKLGVFEKTKKSKLEMQGQGDPAT